MIPLRLSLACAVAGSAAIIHPVFAEREEVTITSVTKTEQNLLDVAATADVFRLEDIQQFQFSDIAEVLELVSSADIVRTGGSYGAVTSLFTRGTASDHTLMLINGQRFSSATLGSASFQFIDPALVKRIEYVRGSRSSLYGSEALGGVLSISTFEDSAIEGTKGSVNLEYGSNASLKTGLDGSAAFGALQLSGGISRLESDGIDQITDDTGFNADRDAYENLSANIFSRYSFNNDAKITFSHYQTEVSTDYDSQFVPSGDFFREQSIKATQLALFVPFGEVYSTELNIGQSGDSSDNFNRVSSSSVPSSVFDTTRQSVYWQNTLNFNAASNLIFGVDHYDEAVDSTTNYDEDERSNTAPFAQLQTELGLVALVFGGRVDDNSQFGDHTTGSASANFSIDDNKRVYFSWAQGFNVPTFNDLYFPGFGNPDLKPEESENLEAGFKWYTQTVSWEFAAYQNDIQNLIEFDGIPQNIGEVEIKGLELNGTIQLDQISVDASASYTSPKDKDTGEDLRFRSKRKFALSLTHDLNIINYGVTIRAYGARSDFVEELEGYQLVDLFVNYAPVNAVNLGLRIQNLFDEDYTQRAGFNTEGQTIKLTSRFNF